jgi:dephospho-CoA kinase
VIDTDDLARQVVEPGQPALEEVRQAFGPAVIGPDGRLDRQRLAGQVFADEGARRLLEGILHPRIRDGWLRRAEDFERQGASHLVIVIPLLFETGAERELDSVICVACSAATQTERLLARGWSREQITARNRAQLPVDEKILRSNFLIWTEGPLAVHAAQLDLILGRQAGLPGSRG